MISDPDMISNSKIVAKEKNDFTFDRAVLEQYPFIFTYEIASTHYCQIDYCNTDQIGACAAYPSGQVYCEVTSYITDNPGGGICPKDEHEGIQKDDEHLSETYAQKNGRVAMYEIRDKILALSPKGKQYIDFYYKLGYVFKITNTYIEKRKEITDVMNFIDNKAAFFITESMSDKIYNSVESKEIITIIKNFKKITNNKEYQQILITLESDLKNMDSKSKSEILFYLL